MLDGCFEVELGDARAIDDPAAEPVAVSAV
jgi:hypothetical protein